VNIFFDVQGTLLTGGVPRPDTREVFIEIASLGHDVYLWSSAGAGYAAMAAETLGVEDLIFGCYSKSVPPPVTVDYAIDDHPDLVERYGGHVVTPFDGDAGDRELWRVVEALRRSAGSP
jgi:hypothetical protein